MTGSNPQFNDPAANRDWEHYFREVDHHLKPLSTQRRQEIRDELVAHVLDGMDAEAGGDECKRLATVLQYAAVVASPDGVGPVAIPESNHLTVIAYEQPAALVSAEIERFVEARFD